MFHDVHYLLFDDDGVFFFYFPFIHDEGVLIEEIYKIHANHHFRVCVCVCVFMYKMVPG